jgi:hypothetical protein
VSGYTCKRHRPTGAVVDLFNDLVNCTDESGATTKSICTKLLMQTDLENEELTWYNNIFHLMALNIYCYNRNLSVFTNKTIIG